MSENIVVAACYTEKEALSFCAAMDAAGVDVIYGPPPLTGNYLIDWNLSLTDYTLRVPEEQAEEARTILDDVGSRFDANVGEVESSAQEFLGSLGPGDFIIDAPTATELDAAAARRALNTAIMSWVFVPLWPYALWKVLSALDKSNTKHSRRRLYVAFALIVSNPLPWVLALIWKSVQAPY